MYNNPPWAPRTKLIITRQLLYLGSFRRVKNFNTGQQRDTIGGIIMRDNDKVMKSQQSFLNNALAKNRDFAYSHFRDNSITEEEFVVLMDLQDILQANIEEAFVLFRKP